MIITIDGPVATGKSTIAKKLAHEIGFIYFDTGAMYRSFTYFILKNKIDPKDAKKVEEILPAFQYKIRVKNGEKRYFVNEEDVTDIIRGQEVTDFVSTIAAYPFVRDNLVHIQREFAEGVNAVFEGRDMGTVVFPKARLKIFLNAKPEIRAKRRWEEMLKKFPEEAKTLSLEKVLHDVNTRDVIDSSREASPLRKAEDAVEIDTSFLSIDEIILQILEAKDESMIAL